MSKKVPEIPSASMADIAFMLLIFFLVSTSMDTPMGIMKMLPPPAPKSAMEDESQKIKERNVFVVLINKDNRLLVEGQPMDINDLKDKAKEFIENPKRDENLPEFKEAEEIPFFGMTEISKQVISLQNDRGTSYGVYIKVQDELTKAYNELRDELARRKFGKHFDDLDTERQDAIRDIYPNRVSEAEPKNYGGQQ